MNKLQENKLRKLIQQEAKKLLKEGTWAIPDTATKMKKAEQILIKFNALQKAMYDCLGDDELFDAIDNVKNRMKKLMDAGRTKLNAV